MWPRLKRIIIWTLVLGPAPALAADSAGTVTAVHDGATFTLGGTEISLFGIDVPALAQQCRADAIYAPGSPSCIPCGHYARDALAGLLQGKHVVCKERRNDKDHRISECTAGEILVGPWMLSQGWAVVAEDSLEKTERPLYFSAQNSAKRAGAGLWSTTFIPPAAWRDQKQRLECER